MIKKLKKQLKKYFAEIDRREGNISRALNKVGLAYRIDARKIEKRLQLKTIQYLKKKGFDFEKDRTPSKDKVFVMNNNLYVVPYRCSKQIKVDFLCRGEPEFDIIKTVLPEGFEKFVDMILEKVEKHSNRINFKQLKMTDIKVEYLGEENVTCDTIDLIKISMDYGIPRLYMGAQNNPDYKMFLINNRIYKLSLNLIQQFSVVAEKAKERVIKRVDNLFEDFVKIMVVERLMNDWEKQNEART